MLPGEWKRATATARRSCCREDNHEHTDPEQSKSSDLTICASNQTENDTIKSTQTLPFHTEDNVNTFTVEPFSADSVLSDLTMIPSVSSARSCSIKKKTKKATTKKANKSSKIKTRANTASTLANPFSITTGHTLLNHPTRTVTDGVFGIHHKKGAKRKRTATATSASVSQPVHVPQLGNINNIQTATNQADLAQTHIQVGHNDIPAPQNMAGNIGNVGPPMVYQHTHVPLHVPTDQIEQQSTSSEDQDSSSDDDSESDINMLGTTHAYQLCNMPIEGTTIINQPQMQFMEPISAAISMQIPNKIKKKIWRNQFFDIAVLLPRTYSENSNTNFSLQLSDKSQISLVPNQAIKKIYTIESWTSAFLRFMAIYTEKSPMEAPHLVKYMEIVRDLARRSQGMSWYIYDQQFRMLRETVPIPWGRLHTEFWLMASSTPNFRPNRQPFHANKSNRSNNQGRKFLERTCWTYNRRGFCGDQSCSFQHKCGYCRGSHPAQFCGPQSRLQPLGSNPGNQRPHTTIHNPGSHSTAHPSPATKQRTN